MDSLIAKSEPLVHLRDVHVFYDEQCALDVEDWSLFTGERVFLLGQSGSGKTTLMRAVKGRVRPLSGTVTVMGDEPTRSDRRTQKRVQRRVAMVDQEFHLVPSMRVIENVLMGCLGRVSPWRSMLGSYPSEEWQKAETILDEVGLTGLGNRRADKLSGGQRQRATLARALMQDAEIIVADEPVSNLDPELAEDALELLIECVERRGATLIVSLHQPALAKRFATRLVGLREGKIIYDGKPEGLTEEASDLLYRSTLPEDMMNPTEPAHDRTSETVEKEISPPDLRLLGR